MEIKALVGDLIALKADAVVVNLFEGVKQPGGATGAVDAALGGAITQLIADGEIKGKLGEVTIIHTLGKMASPRVSVAGLGKAEAFDLERLRMGGVLGVAKGSALPPKFIVLSYKGSVTDRPAVGLVGKGVCFDSGGISIKPGEHMGDMRTDMAGGATVIAAVRALAELKSPLSVTAVVPAVENMPSGTALKPGDVVRFMNGKTAEVISTDAEGRLILADALAYAVQQRLSPIIDVATLTGGIVVALGNVATGIFSKHQELVEKISKAGAEAGEKMWQLPLFEEYAELIKGDYADIKNSGGRAATSITAALFLSNFVGNTPWLHMDIAGSARAEEDKGYHVKFATGVGVRTLVNFVLGLAKE